jgi:aminoglycoside 6-adenylyltransferase
MDNIVQKIVEWAKTQPEIKGLILTSSRAGASEIDEFSDYDIMVLTNTAEKYLISDNWIKEINPVWVYQKESFNCKQNLIPTRLVIFEGNIKVDFSFWPVDIINSFIQDGLSDDMNMGYVVLLDKDGLCEKFPKASGSGFIEKKPTNDEFLTFIYNFWFEVLGVAKYIKRNDMFFAKSIDNGIVKEILLKMVIWNLQSKNDWKVKTHSEGKKMYSWLDDETIETIGSAYSGFNRNESWKSLLNTIEIFRKISKETAYALDYLYPDNVDENISRYIEKMRNES